MIRVIFSQRAQREIDVAAEYYDTQAQGLGLSFISEVEDTSNHIAETPKIYQISYKNFRKAPLERYPFSLFYTIEGDTAVVHAVFDDRQDPAKRPWNWTKLPL